MKIVSKSGRIVIHSAKNHSLFPRTHKTRRKERNPQPRAESIPEEIPITLDSYRFLANSELEIVSFRFDAATEHSLDRNSRILVKWTLIPKICKKQPKPPTPQPGKSDSPTVSELERQAATESGPHLIFSELCSEFDSEICSVCSVFFLKEFARIPT